MGNSQLARSVLDLSILLLIVASIVEVYADVRGGRLPEFLPAPLSGLPSSHPATVLALAGVIGVALGTLLSLRPLPGGRLFVGAIAVVGFLFSGGFIVGTDDHDGGGYHG